MRGRLSSCPGIRSDLVPAEQPSIRRLLWPWKLAIANQHHSDAARSCNRWRDLSVERWARGEGSHEISQRGATWHNHRGLVRRYEDAPDRWSYESAEERVNGIARIERNTACGDCSLWHKEDSVIADSSDVKSERRGGARSKRER